RRTSSPPPARASRASPPGAWWRATPTCAPRTGGGSGSTTDPRCSRVRRTDARDGDRELPPAGHGRGGPGHHPAGRPAGPGAARLPSRRAGARPGVRRRRHAPPRHRPGRRHGRPDQDRGLRRPRRGAGPDHRGRAGQPHRDARRAARVRLPRPRGGGGGRGVRAQAVGADTGAVRRCGGHDQEGSGMRAVLSLGSNLGRRIEYLQGAVDALFDAPGLTLVAISSVYETEPVGGPEQGPYLNAVLVVETAHPPRVLLERVQSIEEAFGRTREVRWGPRTLDIDLIKV